MRTREADAGSTRAAGALARLREQQFTLARHIRDPQHHAPPPDIEDRRLAIYRELFYNNIEGLLAGNFPVIRRLLGNDTWHALVRAFYAEHRCRTPLFPEIAREFLRYLETREAIEDDALFATYPFIGELAHYEWAELALEIEEAAFVGASLLATGVESDADGSRASSLLQTPLTPSPLAKAYAYHWPVHLLGPDFRPTEPPAQPTCVLLQREADGRVRFAQIDPLTFRLLQRLDETPALSGREQLLALAEEVDAPDAVAFVALGATMLAQLRERGVL